MPAPTPQQLAVRRRIESLIRFAEPGLDLMLWLGEKLALRVAPDDGDYVPPRPLDESSPLRGGRTRSISP
ncbi:MAG: hypothetical protein QOK31_1981 [Solirubrobacteraceae bacterium]|jgi:hypothetical protein|nr:hypothetical protein [Solirubrobacteraceae bacterium]